MPKPSSSPSNPPPTTTQLPFICSVCGQKSLLRCSKCLGTLYCGEECQTKDWKVHKIQCREAEMIKKQYIEQGHRTVEEIDAEIESTKHMAEQGNAQAQFNLGLSYEKGLGVAVDRVESVKWYKLAAEQGHAHAQYNLGCSYDVGEGVIADKNEAFKWYKSAAEKGDSQAQNSLGDAYFNGKGVSQNATESVTWYRLAAKQGNPFGQFNLAMAYLHGDGTPVNKEEGVKWMKHAARNGVHEAILYMESYQE